MRYTGEVRFMRGDYSLFVGHHGNMLFLTAYRGPSLEGVKPYNGVDHTLSNVALVDRLLIDADAITVRDAVIAELIGRWRGP